MPWFRYSRFGGSLGGDGENEVAGSLQPDPHALVAGMAVVLAVEEAAEAGQHADHGVQGRRLDRNQRLVNVRDAFGVRTRFRDAVSGKIAVLVFIILFIQKRPSGMFALRGRAAEA